MSRLKKILANFFSKKENDIEVLSKSFLDAINKLQISAQQGNSEDQVKHLQKGYPNDLLIAKDWLEKSA